MCNIKFIKVKSLLKLVSLSLTVLLFSCCKTEAQENEKEKDTRKDISYTDNFACVSNSYLQMDGYTLFFNRIAGGYSYWKSVNKNAFFFSLCTSDSLSANYQHYATFSIITEKMEPEQFFQKGVREIHSIRIDYFTYFIGGGEFEVEYYDTRSVLTWDTVSYVNRLFEGKGSIEIMDTLQVKHIYDGRIQCFPPQKIEFEFDYKKYFYE